MKKHGIPRRPVGSSPKWYFMQWVWDQLVHRLNFIDSSTVKWNFTSKGIYATAAAQNGGSAIPANASKYNLTNIYANYFIASGVRIAKNPKLRNSVMTESIDGNVFTYAYGASAPFNFVSRQATGTVSGNAVSEFQVIVPRYLTNDEIWAIPATTGIVSVADVISATPGAEITLLDLNVDGRAWCASVQGAYETNTP